MTVSATLLISCPDAHGIVAAVSRFVYEHEGNVLHADQHVDGDTFLQRVEWDLAGFDLDREAIVAAFEPIAQRFGMDWRLSFSDHQPRLAIFVSKFSHCMHDLLARARMKELRATIPLVVSNHQTHRDLAERFDIDFVHIPVTKSTKAEAEARTFEVLDEYNIDGVILARYMQILSAEFVRRYSKRIINIHHSFLPAFPGARPYHRAHKRGVKIIGATAHYVTADLDEGPIIEQDVTRVSHRDSARDLVLKGRDLEKVVLARAVKAHLSDRVLIYGNKTVVF